MKFITLSLTWGTITKEREHTLAHLCVKHVVTAKPLRQRGQDLNFSCDKCCTSGKPQSQAFKHLISFFKNHPDQPYLYVFFQIKVFLKGLLYCLNEPWQQSVNLIQLLFSHVSWDKKKKISSFNCWSSLSNTISLFSTWD